MNWIDPTDRPTIRYSSTNLLSTLFYLLLATVLFTGVVACLLLMAAWLTAVTA